MKKFITLVLALVYFVGYSQSQNINYDVNYNKKVFYKSLLEGTKNDSLVAVNSLGQAFFVKQSSIGGGGTQNLQQTIDNGGKFESIGTGYERLFRAFDADYPNEFYISAYSLDEEGVEKFSDITMSENGLYNTGKRVEEGVTREGYISNTGSNFSFTRTVDGGSTILEFEDPSPTVYNGTILIPAPPTAGTYKLALASELGLQAMLDNGTASASRGNSSIDLLSSPLPFTNFNSYVDNGLTGSSNRYTSIKNNATSAYISSYKDDGNSFASFSVDEGVPSITKKLATGFTTTILLNDPIANNLIRFRSLPVDALYEVAYLSDVAVPASASAAGIVNNVALQELGGVDKVINGVRIGKGNYTGVTTNTLVGSNSLLANVSGASNTAIGRSVLTSLTTGSGNTGVGSSTLFYTVGGDNNTAVGRSALSGNTSTSPNNARNIALGAQAGNSLLTGNDNILIGSDIPVATNAGIQTGNANIIIGKLDNGHANGDNNTIIGRATGLSASLNNSIILADGAGVVGIRKESDHRLLAPSLTNALVDAGGAKSLVTREYVRREVVETAASSYAIPFTKDALILYGGTTVTTTLPALAGGSLGAELTLVNSTTTTLTINSNTGGLDIWEEGVSKSTVDLPINRAYKLINSGARWLIIK